ADIGIDEVIYRASNWRPAPIVQAVPENPYALAQIEALTTMVQRVKDDLGDVQQRLACGTGYTSGTISPMLANGVKRRLQMIGERLGPCRIRNPKTKKIMGASNWRGVYDQQLRSVLA